MADPAALIAALASPAAKTRREAVAQLGKSGSPEAVGPLLCLLADPHPAVRVGVTVALGRLDDEDRKSVV